MHTKQENPTDLSYGQHSQNSEQ